MNNKKCSLCFKEKPINEFYLNSKNNKISSRCKNCTTSVIKMKYQSDVNYRNRIKENNKKSNNKNKKNKKIRDKEYQSRPTVRERINNKRKEKYQLYGISENRKEYLSNYMKTYNKEYKNRPEIKTKIKEYRKTDTYKTLKRNYHQRHKNSPKYKIRRNISKGIWKSLKGKKNGSWVTFVDYTIKELMHHLENNFKSNMTWENYGEWHIDHIRPVSSFNITCYECEDFKQCWALKNLQPLWAIENLKKGDRF